MGLLDDVAKEPRKVSHVSACLAARMIATLTPSEQQELEEAFTNPEFTTAAIVRVLNRRGVDVKQDSLSRHRHRKCACGHQ